jgi:tRNA-specific 2-thiouridylase
VLCNCEIKFKAFLEFAMAADAKGLATGHYARLDKSRGISLMRAKDSGKDQTYFLAGLTSKQLERVIFPVGDMVKRDVRAIAAEAGLSTALKKDSTGICFIGERNFKEFLMRYLPAQPGDMVDETGRVIGRHDGLMYYTLGQRRGLGIGGRSCGTGDSWFVIGKDIKRNLLIVQQGEHEELYSTALTTGKPNWIAGSAPSKMFECTAKFRYRQTDQKVTVYAEENSCTVRFASLQRAVTPGQWAVFYDGEVCLGGAPISDTVPQKAIMI